MLGQGPAQLCTQIHAKQTQSRRHQAALLHPQPSARPHHAAPAALSSLLLSQILHLRSVWAPAHHTGDVRDLQLASPVWLPVSEARMERSVALCSCVHSAGLQKPGMKVPRCKERTVNKLIHVKLWGTCSCTPVPPRSWGAQGRVSVF